MTLYVIRHGQTKLNADGVIQGWIDEPLNEQGRRQAEALAPFFLDKNIDCLICSPLKRAAETAAILNATLKLPLYEDERLKERSFGELEGCSYRELLWDESIDAPKFFLDEYCTRGAEPMQHMYGRIDDFLRELAMQTWKQVILVTHGGVASYLSKRFDEHALHEHQVIVNGEIWEYNLQKEEP